MKRKNYALFMALPGNEFSTNVLLGAEKAAKELDANLLIFPIGLIDGDYWDKEENVYQYQYNVLQGFLSANSIDGAVIEYGTIVSDARQERKSEFLSHIGAFPVVMIAEDAEGFPSIRFENARGLREVILHLIKDHGCRKIGFVSGPKENNDARERLNVYREIVKEENLGLGEDWIVYGNFSSFSKEAVGNLLDRHPDIEAIAFANDEMAFGGYEVLKERGLKVGRDILFTGFDNSPQTRLINPPLSSVYADAVEMSYRAMMALDKGATDEYKELLPTRMVKRQSCGCKNMPVYDEKGELLGSEAEINFRLAAIDKIEEAKADKGFFGEVRNVTREVIRYQDSDEEWMTSILRSMDRIGCKSPTLFFYDKPREHKATDEWLASETLYLRAYQEGQEAKVFDALECPYIMKELFHAPFMERENRMDILVTPLFYRETQFGFLLSQCPILGVQFAYQMAAQISNTIEMVYVRMQNERIKQELIDANKAKSLFLAKMSHEIRTPINAIVGMNEMILRENQDEEIQNYAQDIKGATNFLLSIINEILDLSKIEADKMVLTPVSYNVMDFLDEIIHQMSFRAKDKGIDLVLEVDNAIPSVLFGDDLRMRQILINLLSNGIKYTEKGQVTLKVTLEECMEADQARVCYEVIDTGIGIKEDFKKLFENFVRVDEVRNRRVEGTGLGMSITAGLLDLMGSHLEVQSEYNKGSVFSFVLQQPIVDMTPIRREKKKSFREQKPEEAEHFQASEVRILLVDDNDVNRLVVKRLLKKTQIIIDEAVNGQKCLEMMRENTYDMVLLDHMMPVMDGMEALAEIRKMPGYEKGKPPIVALTANAVIGASKEYLDAGFDAYLSKPIFPHKLDEILYKFLPEEKVHRNS